MASVMREREPISSRRTEELALCGEAKKGSKLLRRSESCPRLSWRSSGEWEMFCNRERKKRKAVEAQPRPQVPAFFGYAKESGGLGTRLVRAHSKYSPTCL